MSLPIFLQQPLPFLPSSCQIHPPSLQAWLWTASVHGGITLFVGVPLALVAYYHRHRPWRLRIVALLLAMGIPWSLHAYQDKHGMDQVPWMCRFLINTFTFGVVLKLWNVSADQVPPQAYQSLHTFCQWFLVVPEPKLLLVDADEKDRRLDLAEIQAQWHSVCYKIVTATLLLSLLLPWHEQYYQINPLTFLEPDKATIPLTNNVAAAAAAAVVQVVLNGFVHIWWMYIFLAFCLDVSSLLHAIVHGPVEKGFCNPLLASRSLRQAWGTRWNLPVQKHLHRTVYQPLRQEWGCSRVTAALGTFVGSGLLHEYNFWSHNYGAYRSPGAVTAFFVAMGILMLAEAYVWDHWCPQPVQKVIEWLPSPVIAVGLTLLVSIPVEHYFVPTWLEAGMIESVSQLFPHITCDWGEGG